MQQDGTVPVRAGCFTPIGRQSSAGSFTVTASAPSTPAGQEASGGEAPIYLSVVTIGELRRGIELIRHRGDVPQAQQLEAWLQSVLTEYADCILPMDEEIAQIWGRLGAPHPEHALDKQIAATALIHSLTVVTRNQRDFEATGVRILNSFEKVAPCGVT